jgi:hypothetical protein
MANPKRSSWKNYRQIKEQYRVEFWTKAVLGALIFWPIAIKIGRRAQIHGATGVPSVYYPKIFADFPNNGPHTHAKRFFNLYAYGSSLMAGYFFASLTTSSDLLFDEYWSRPDFKAHPAMVTNGEDELVKQMREQIYAKERAQKTMGDFKRSAWFRTLFPGWADFSMHNTWNHLSSIDKYDARHPHFRSNLRFEDHHFNF